MTEVERLTLELGRRLYEQWGERGARRTAVVGEGMLRLVRDGHASFDDFDNDKGQATEAVMEAIRFSVDALSEDAVPMIARLSGRPIDHFYRGVCRMLVDLDASELVQLAALIGAAARVVPARLARLPDEGRDDQEVAGVMSVGYARAMVNIARADVTDLTLEEHGEEVRWTFPQGDDSDAVAARNGDPVLVLLLAHRIAREPERNGPKVTVSEYRVHIDRRLLTIPIATLLDLHFVLSGERIADPREAARTARSHVA